MYLKVVYKNCEHINSKNLFSNQGLVGRKEENQGRNRNPLARRAVLGCLQQRLGHSHFKASWQPQMYNLWLLARLNMQREKLEYLSKRPPVKAVKSGERKKTCEH